MTTAAPSPLRVSSAQEAIDLLYHHFIKNRHRPAYNKSMGCCFTMPRDACYPRCAVGILTKPSVIRKEAHLDCYGTVYNTNARSAWDALRILGRGKNFAENLRMAHDEAARHYHVVWNPATEEKIYDQHTSFRSAFAASLRLICAHYNLQYPGDPAHD